ncbi:WD repeat-containing protein CG11141 [Cephus cinctus]|uniref:WD repeat-containing protein CG11141 n=1 Tax=Cephus cinctus TaxID=211228 RepID=A0AAJ7RGN8_CEPCN|nr:WD repeat-containing protein CG11141 [Cephus cinctus]XP_024940538.1 WD repeat-containing protein CG11141 [Cephus cinctus]
MTTPMCEDGGPLREWAPLSILLQQIPVKCQNGIFTQDMSFTSIDAVAEYIAIGTNHGLVYWYSREKGDLQRLRCENSNAPITCVRVISTVDYMVAVGNDQGVVSVFQIPKNPPDSLPDSLKPKQKKQVERYTIAGLHKSAVTAVEWSKNGMKLFSGDKDGLVVLTEIDFYMHLSKSSELLNEKYSVVQLSYQQGHLLVSTVFRTILVNRSQNDKVSQVGQKERKMLGRLGATFGPCQDHTRDPVIYASRPGLRLWQADKFGTVLKTLIFKDAVRSTHTEVELLNPASETAKLNRSEPTFGVVLPFCDDLLVTYNDEMIYVVNPATIAITSAVTDLRRITNVACTKDEIFILEGDRNIIRLAYYPETNNLSSSINMESLIDPLASIAEISRPVTAGILELTSKLKESSIVPAIPFRKINPTNFIQSMSMLSTVNVGTDTTTVINAEEATEMPPIVPLNLNTPLITDVDLIPEHSIPNKHDVQKEEECRNDRRFIFHEIGRQEFEDIVFTPERKSKRSGYRLLNGNDNPSSQSDSDDCTVNLNKNIIGNNNKSMRTTHSSLLTLSIDDDFIFRTERPNLETIQRDVETKEKLLASVLNFDLSEYMTGDRIYSTDSSTPNSIDTITYVNCNAHTNGMTTIINRSLVEPEQVLEVKNEDEEETRSENTETESVDEEDESYRTELKKLVELGECSKKLLQSKLAEPRIPDACIGQSNIESNTLRKALPTEFAPELCGVDHHQELEIRFNVLSKEFVTSAIIEDADWVLL